MTDILTHPSYAQIHEMCLDIVQQVKQLDYKPDIVVGLTRGGLVPAVIISHALGDLPVYPVSYSSKKGKGTSEYSNYIPQIDPGLHRPKSTLLIVDDIADSGRTLKEVYTDYAMWGHPCHTAVLFYKEGAAIVPDIYCCRLPEDAPWIHYPWEVPSDK